MLRKYEMELDELKHPLMVEESSYECPNERLNSPEKIVKLLNECFRLDKNAEEYVYMLAFDPKCNPLGVLLTIILHMTLPHQKMMMLLHRR